MKFDILIQSGILLDGTNAPPKVADIGIRGGKISYIGALEDSTGDVTISALGKYVTPGFIDITNQSDSHLTMFQYPLLESLVLQGITTIIGGNCGASLAPLASGTAINAIKKWANPAQININWTGVSEYLRVVETLKFGINYGTFVGYGTLRRGVLGDTVRTLSPQETEQIKYLLGQSIAAGAFGLSLGMSYGHESISTTDELIEIAGIMRETGGIVKIHLRSEGSKILAAINEAVLIGRGTGVPVEISHLKMVGKKSWHHIKKALELISTARKTGVDIHFDVSPYKTTGSSLYLLIPEWARSKGFTELFRLIENKADRKRIVDDLKLRTLHYDKILITSAKITPIVGKTIADLSAESGLPPEETLLATVIANDGRVTIVGRTLSGKNTEAALVNTNSMLGSDGEGYADTVMNTGNLVHPRSFGAFAYFWRRFVQEKKSLPPEAAIQKMTSLPALKVGLHDRGIIKKGNMADVLIFDPAQFRDQATYEYPFKYATGLEAVIMNGRVVVDKGNHTGERAGQVMRYKK